MRTHSVKIVRRNPNGIRLEMQLRRIEYDIRCGFKQSQVLEQVLDTCTEYGGLVLIALAISAAVQFMN